MSENLAYPLSWPIGWPRTAANSRERGTFDGTLGKVVGELLQEIDRIALGANSRTHTIQGYVVISTNLPLRRDGLPRADSRAPDDPGVAVYFKRKDKEVCFACDKYDQVWKNLRAVQKTIEAMRGIERWGSAQMLERAFTGFAALPQSSGPDCWETLGVTSDATEDQIMAAYRARAKHAHPDIVGGSHEKFAELCQAKDIAVATVRSKGG